MIPHRRQPVEGRAAAKFDWHGDARSYRKIGCSGEESGGYSHIHDRRGGGEIDTPAQSALVLSAKRRESTQEDQKRGPEEFLLEQLDEGEQWRRRDIGWSTPSPHCIAGRILLNDEEEDGVHGGRMKPLTSFDLNRGMPHPHNRTLKIKLSSSEDNPSSTTDGVAPKAIRRAQDKENGGLVPLCPGTTQISGIKRKIVNPTELKPQGGKRARPLTEPAKTAEESRMGPALELEGDGNQRMGMLLMALAADPNQRLISPSQSIAGAAVVHASTGDQAIPPVRPALRARTSELPVCQRQDLSRSDTDDELTPDEFDKRHGPFMKRHRDGPSLVQIKETVDLTKDDDEDLSSSDDEYDLTPEEFERKYGPIMKPHRYRLAPCQKAPLKDAMVNIKETVDVKSDDDDLSCSDDESDLSPEEFEKKFSPFMKPHRYRRVPYQSAPLTDVLVKEDQPCSRDDTGASGNVSNKHLQEIVKLARDKIKGLVDGTKEDDEGLSFSNDDKDTYGEELEKSYGSRMGPNAYRAAPLEDEVECKNDKTKDREESISRGQDPLEKKVTRSHSICRISREALDNPEEILEASTEEVDELRCTKGLDWKVGDGATNTCVLEIRRQAVTTRKAFPESLRVARPKLFVKSANSVDGRREHRGENRSCNADIIETVITPEVSNVHPSQARALWFQEKNSNQRVAKVCRTTKLNRSTSVESYQVQHEVSEHEVSEREPTRHDSIYRISLREDFDDAEKLERSHTLNQEHDFRRCPLTWGKYPGARQQLARKQFSGASGPTYSQQVCNSKKRKATGHNSAFCIVPEQVKFSTASCLIGNGESSHPSVGSVVVECLPPSTEHKQDNRPPFSEFQNQDAAVSHCYNSLQAPFDGSIWDPDKENISWVRNTATGPPSSAGEKVPCKQDLEVITTAQNDASFLNRSGLSSIGSDSGSRIIQDTSSRNSLLGQQISRTDVAPSYSQNFYSSGLQYGSRAKQLQQPQQQQQHQQQRPTSSSGAGSGTCTSNGDNETRHEIAGITVQRRSWVALKSTEAEYFAKRRSDPNTEAAYDNNYVPFIPSRFQSAECPIRRVSSNVKPKPDFETQLRHDATLSRSIGVTTHAGVAEKRVTLRRGPKQGKQERLSTKVLNRNLEHFVQLKNASCHRGRGNAFRTLNQTRNGGNFSVDVSQPQFSLARSYCVVPTLPSQKTRQRRGAKRIDKERMKTIITKTTSSSCHFKSLSEPSGLLGSLNPGIIGRVRNSKQIHAILGALIGIASSYKGRDATLSVSLPRVSQHSAHVHVTSEAEGELKEQPVEGQEIFLEEENVSRPKIGEVQRSTEKEQLKERDIRKETLDEGQPLPSNVEQCHEQKVTSEILGITSECAPGLVSLRDKSVDGDHLCEETEPLAEMLSSLSGIPDDTEDDIEKELQPMSVTDSSSAAAGLAARWLELLSLDVKGRLAALELSRRRVESTLLSGPLNLPCSSSSIGVDVLGSQRSVCSDASTIKPSEIEFAQQMDRWRALFTNMDVVLSNEATKLKSWLCQVNQMLAFCPSSTLQLSPGPEKSQVALSQGLAKANDEIERQPPKRWPLTIDAVEKQLGFAASAASITSTANFVAKFQNFR